jgi:hypothetical protein
MKQHMRFVIIMAASLFAILPFRLSAQFQEESGGRYVLHVEGLTSQDRDELRTVLNGRDDLRLVFACVPAGVLVFEPGPGETKQHALERIRPLLDAKALRSRSHELHGGMAEAEAACVNARN